MECYSEQTCAIFLDGELAPDEAQFLQAHLTTCPRCWELVQALRDENRALSESLNELPEETLSPVSFSPRHWSWPWGDVAILAAVLALGSIVVHWIDTLSIPSALEWVNPFSRDGLTNMVFNLSYYFAHGGTAMLADYAAVVGGIFLLLGGATLLLGRRSRLHLSAFPLLIVLLTLSLPSLALDRRQGEFVTVAANETVDDTLVATGNTVVVEGVVNGDLLVFAQTLEVRGNVRGDVVSLAKRTVVSGTVEGRIFNCSRSMELDGELGHSLYNWGQSLRVDRRAHVGEGIVAGGDISLEGEVKRSATLYGEVNVSGTVGRDLTLAGGRLGSLVLTNTARVGGDLTARVRELKDVQIADGASISGKRDIQLRVRENRFTSPRFYLHQVLWLAAAMLVGWLGLALFPGFFQACTQAVGSGWRSLGLGLGVLAAIPVVIVLAAITLVGFPISLMLLALYVAAIYLAKLWVGAFLGRILLKPAITAKRDWLLRLLVGLIILTIVGFIPYLGGLVRLVVVCLGLGAFAWQLYQGSRPVMTS
jgi:cytoskeletal protein CcmA (bactofilin family)